MYAFAVVFVTVLAHSHRESTANVTHCRLPLMLRNPIVRCSTRIKLASCFMLFGVKSIMDNYGTHVSVNASDDWRSAWTGPNGLLFPQPLYNFTGWQVICTDYWCTLFKRCWIILNTRRGNTFENLVINISGFKNSENGWIIYKCNICTTALQKANLCQDQIQLVNWIPYIRRNVSFLFLPYDEGQAVIQGRWTIGNRLWQ